MGRYLVERTDGTGNQHVARQRIGVHFTNKLVVIGKYGRNNTARTVSRCGSHRSPPAAFSSFTASANMLIQSTTTLGQWWFCQVLTSIGAALPHERGTRSLPGRTPSVVIPRSIPPRITSQTLAKCCSSSSLLCSGASSFSSPGQRATDPSPGSDVLNPPRFWLDKALPWLSC